MTYEVGILCHLHMSFYYRGHLLNIPTGNKNPYNCNGYRDLYISNVLYYLLKAVATSTAQATVHPTIGLLPIPRNPIIST